MNYFIINVSGKHGYSFMVCGEFAFADGLVTEQDIEHFKNNGCCYSC